MKKPKGYWRSLVAAGLVSATLALPLSHAVAEQRQQYLPLSPYTQPQEQEEGPSTAAKWLGRAFFIGLVYCVLTDCMGGGNSGSGGQSSPSPEEIDRLSRGSGGTPKHEYALPDTSMGCVHGDRRYGTCIE
jgi:hypothetical protein